MKKSDQFAMICQITAMRYQAIQLEMSQLLEQECALRRNLDQLIQGRNASFGETGDDADTAMIAGAAIRWQRWVDQRRTVINTELAQVLAQKIELRKNLQLAFGRDQVAQTLSKQEFKKTRQTVQRRANYVS